MRVTIFLLILCFGLSSCEKTPKEDLELNELFGLMQGSFNSEAQSRQDSTYYNISLHMYPI